MRYDRTIRTLAAILIIGTLGVCGCGPRYKQAANIDVEGDIGSIYKIPLRDSRIRDLMLLMRAAEKPEGGSTKFTAEGYPISHGAAFEAMRDGEIIMKMMRISEDQYEIRFHNPLTYRLETTDGLQHGTVRRTIHSGTRLVVETDDFSIRSVDGPEDEYEVISPEAKIKVGGRITSRKQGIYTASEFL